MEADSGTPLKELRVDGGAANNDLLMQFQADTLGVEVVRPQDHGDDGAGARRTRQGLAVDFWSGKDELESLWEEEKRFEPQMEQSQREELTGRWHDALERSKSWQNE